MHGTEEYQTPLETLRVHLEFGAQQARDGQFIEDYAVDILIAELDDEVGESQ